MIVSHRAEPAPPSPFEGSRARGRCRRRLQNALTTLASFDYKTKSVVTAQVATHHAFAGKTLGAQAEQLESYDYAGIYAFANRFEGERYALLHREAVEARNKDRFGLSGVRTFRPGTCFDLSESPLDSLDQDPAISLCRRPRSPEVARTA